jgi:hypothetical protein
MSLKKYALIALLATSLLTACGTKAEPAVPTTTAPSASQAPATSGDDVESSEGEELADADASLPATDAESGWGGTYAGKLDGKIEVSLELHGLRDIVRGTITYKKSGKPIMVLGTMNTDGTFFLHEFQPDGNITGVMSGTEKGQKLTGTWYAPNSEKELQMELAAVTVQEEGSAVWPYDSKGVAGDYDYHYGKDGPMGSLVVKQTGDKLRFKFDCLGSAPGRNMALVEETQAVLSGNEAVYEMPDLECKFRIQFFDGFAVVGYVDEKYDCEFGHNATIEGIFVKLK